MAIGPHIFQEKYKNLCVEELEKKYKELEEHMGLTNKEARIKFMAENFLNNSVSNYYTEKTVLEEILKMKTGKDYRNNLTDYNEKITLNDIIVYISEGDNSKVSVLNSVIDSIYNDAIGELLEEILSIYAGEVINEVEKINDDNIEAETITELLEDRIEETTLRKILDKKVKEFLLILYNDKNTYNEFFEEALSTTDYVPFFVKYYLKLYDYRINNSYIC